MRLGDWLFMGGVCLVLLTLRRRPYLWAELALALGFGALWERLFSNFWTYNPSGFGLFAAANLPVAMLAYWIVLLLGGMAISARLTAGLGSRLPAASGPWSDVPWDVCAFAILGMTMETLGLRLGLWRYEAGLSLGLVPGLGISVFAALGYISIGSLVPTSIRFWRRYLVFARPGARCTAPAAGAGPD